MGQRLVIDFKDCKNNPLGAIYYHWSGFSNSSCEKLVDFMSNWENTNPNHEDLLRFLETCKQCGYGIAYDNSKLPPDTVKLFKKHIDRNHGIFAIAADTDEYDELKNWGDTLIEVNFATNEVIHSVFNIYSSVSEYNSEMPDDIQITPDQENKLIHLQSTVDIYPIDDIYKICHLVTNAPDMFYNGDGSLIEKIR